MSKFSQLFILAILCFSAPLAAQGSTATSPAAVSPAAMATATAQSAQIAELTKQAEDARYAKDIAEIRAELLQSQTSWFEVSTSSNIGLLAIIIGLFGVLITALMVFFTFKVSRDAVAEAKYAAVEELKTETANIQKLLNEAKAAVAEIHIERETARQLTQDMAPGETPSDPATVEKISELAKNAQEKPRRERTLDDYRALVIIATIEEDWPAMERRASAMAYLFEDEADDEGIAFALLSKAYALGKLNRHEDAIAAYDDLADRFGNKDSPALQEQVAKALVNKGITLGQLKRHEDAITVYNDVVDRFGDKNSPALQELVVNALVSKGYGLGQLERHDDAITVYNDVVDRFGDKDSPALQELVVNALVSKGLDLNELKRHNDAIAAYEDVVARFGDEDSSALQELVKMALVNKAITLGQLERHEDAIAAYEDVVARLGDKDSPALQERVASALFNKACALALSGNVDACVEALRMWGEQRGGVDCDAIKNDTDFNRIRRRKAFKEFLAESGCG